MECDRVVKGVKSKEAAAVGAIRFGREKRNVVIQVEEDAYGNDTSEVGE